MGVKKNGQGKCKMALGGTLQGRAEKGLRVNNALPRGGRSSQGPLMPFPFSNPVGLWYLVIFAEQASEELGKTEH